MLKRNRLLGPTRPKRRVPPVTAPQARQQQRPPIDERQFQGPPQRLVPQGPKGPQGPPDWRQDWSSHASGGPGNARTMPPPPSVTAFRPPPVRALPTRLVAGPSRQSESTRMREDPVEHWTPDFTESPVKQSRANRATFMFAALLLLIVLVAYIVRKRANARSFGYSVGGGGGGFSYAASGGDYANW